MKTLGNDEFQSGTRRVNYRLGVAGAVFCCILAWSWWGAGPAAGEEIDATWQSAASGSWTASSRWSTPVYPDNGRPDPDDRYRAIIDAVGAPYEVTLRDRDITLDVLTLDSPDATLRHGSGTLAVERIELAAGTYVLENSGSFSPPIPRIAGATIVGTGGTLQVSAEPADPRVLQNVTLDVDLEITSTSVVNVMIEDRLTIAEGREVRLFRTGNALYIQGMPTIDGSGAIVFTGREGHRESPEVRFDLDSVLTIGPDVSVRTESGGGIFRAPPIENSGAGLINEGTLTGQTFRVSLAVFPDAGDVGFFENRGVVEAIGQGHVIVGGDWTNLGVLRLRDEGVLDLDGVFTSDDIGTLDRDGGTLRITGILENEGRTFSANAETGSIELANYQTGADLGIIRGGRIETANGSRWTVDRGRLEDVEVAGAMDVHGRLGIHGDLTLAEDATIRLFSSDSITAGAVLAFVGPSAEQSLRGQGRILFTGGRGNTVQGFRDGTFSVGPDVSIGTAGGNGGLTDGVFINDGTINVGAGDGFDIVTHEFTNRGEIDVSGRLLLGGTRRFGPETEWSNEGTITLRPGSTLRIGGVFETEDIGTFVDEGAAVVELLGTLVNTDRTLDLDALGLSVPLLVRDGTIRGGRLASDGPRHVQFIENRNLLQDVTLAADAVLLPSADVNVEGELTLDDAVVTLSSSDLRFRNPDQRQRLGGQGEIVFGIGTGVMDTRGVITSSEGRDLTIGPGVTIRTGSGVGTLDGETAPIINEGRIHAAARGGVELGHIDVKGSFENRGTVSAGPLGLVTLEWPLVENIEYGTLEGGTWLADSGELRIAGARITGNAADVELRGGAVFEAFESLANNVGRLRIAEGHRFELEGDLVNQGELSIDSHSIAVLPGDFEQLEGGMLLFELDRMTDPDASIFEVDGTAYLGGTIEVQLAADYRPRNGDTFGLFQAGEIVLTEEIGQLLLLPDLPRELSWDDSQFATSGRLAIVPEPSTGILCVLLVSLMWGVAVHARVVGTCSPVNPSQPQSAGEPVAAPM